MVAPLELVRTQLQAQVSSAAPADAAGGGVRAGGGDAAATVRMIREHVQQRGWRYLWNGLGPTLWRDVPFSAIYWYGYEALKERAYRQWGGGSGSGNGNGYEDGDVGRRLGSSRGGGRESLEEHRRRQLMAGKKTSEFTYGQTLGVSFMSGAASGGVASLITQPFDVVKTRRQVDQYNLGNNHVHSHGQGQGHGHGEGSHGHGRSHSHGQSQSGAGGGGGGGGKGGGWVGSGGRTTFAGIQRIVAEEGFFGLYAGSLPRMLKVAPACAVMISSYEIGKRVFGRISTAEG